jgi:ketosteroid isomerase-like protein
MSQEDFEVVREAWAIQSREGDVRGWLHLAGEDIEMVPFGAALQGKVYRGHEGLREWWDSEISPNWETFQVLPEQFQMVGDRMLIFGRWRARGRTSGVDLDAPGTWLVEIRDRKIVWISTYTNRDEALKAAGLSE